MNFLFKATALVSLLFVLGACGFTERDFIGKWEVYDLELQSEWRSGLVDDELRDRFKNVTYEFLPEGRMNYSVPRGTAQGTWSIDGENLNMNFGFNDWNFQDLKCKILSCTSGKMALSFKLKENETWILYFQQKE